jgi:Zinc finger, C3HC4 type (RING finger)
MVQMEQLASLEKLQKAREDEIKKQEEQHVIRAFNDLASAQQTRILEEIDENNKCTICCENPRTTALLPCRHFILCDACAKKVRDGDNRCPNCRQPVEQLMNIFH